MTLGTVKNSTAGVSEWHSARGRLARHHEGSETKRGPRRREPPKFHDVDRRDRPQPMKSPHFGGGSVTQGISGTVEVEFFGEPCTTLSE